ncbi:MAG: outer membrane beta-barrel protein [Bacteroidota bacterium]
MTRFVIMLILMISAGTTLVAQQYSGIGINLFPNYSHRRLVNFDISLQNEADSLELNEISRPSYATGFFLSYRGRKAGVQVGLNYSQTGYRGTRQQIPFGDPNRVNFNEQQYQFRAQNIELPFAVQFYQTLSDTDDFFFMLGSGISYNLSNQNIITRFNGETSAREVLDDEDDDFRRVNYSFQTAMGWEHKFSDRFVMSLAPTFRLWLAGVKRDALLNRNLYQFGIRLTMRWEREIEVY